MDFPRGIVVTIRTSEFHLPPFMLDLQRIRDDPDQVRQALHDRGNPNLDLVDRVLAGDAARRDRLTKLQEAQARSNTVSREIGLLMREGKKDEAQERIAETGRLKQQIKQWEDEARDADAALEELLLEIPNIPHESVPVGRTAADNQVVHEEGEKPGFDFEPLAHWDLLARHGLADFERGARVTGAGFPFYLGKGARLHRALINFFLDVAVREGGYLEVHPPLLVNEDSARGTGQLPDKEGQMYLVLDQSNFEVFAKQTERWFSNTAVEIFWIARELIHLRNDDFFPKSYTEIADPSGTHTEETIRRRHTLANAFLTRTVRDRVKKNKDLVYKVFEMLNVEHFKVIINPNEESLTLKLSHDYWLYGRGAKALVEELLPKSSRRYLVPTAEVPVTNYYRGEILDEGVLPLKLCAYTPCWRREAGSWGAHVRGLNRLHQFDKVELVRIVHPDTSYQALEELREDAERVLRRLALPYRRLLMCTGDMGFNQTKQYDLEVWSAGQQRWLEVSSVSNFTSYQARRMQLRYRPREGGSPQIVHTLNGSGLALPRIVAALLENNQQASGSVVIPEALQPYTGFDRIG